MFSGRTTSGKLQPIPARNKEPGKQPRPAPGTMDRNPYQDPRRGPSNYRQCHQETPVSVLEQKSTTKSDHFLSQNPQKKFRRKNRVFKRGGVVEILRNFLGTWKFSKSIPISQKICHENRQLFFLLVLRKVRRLLRTSYRSCAYL